MNAKTPHEHDAPKPSGTAKVVATARESAERIAETTRATAQEVARRASVGIEANPLAVLVGGVALGVFAGAFVPRTEQETRFLSPVGRRLTDTAKGAVDAAKDAGRSELALLGISRLAARDQVGKLLEGAIKAFATAGTAAVNANQKSKAD